MSVVGTLHNRGSRAPERYPKEHLEQNKKALPESRAFLVRQITEIRKAEGLPGSKSN